MSPNTCEYCEGALNTHRSLWVYPDGKPPTPVCSPTCAYQLGQRHGVASAAARAFVAAVAQKERDSAAAPAAIEPTAEGENARLSTYSAAVPTAPTSPAAED